MDKNLADIAAMRLSSQQLDRTKFKTAKELVAWIGAMQAQDYPMVKWGLGVRVPNLTVRDVEAALNAGEILRTHVLRPTWHLVSADDIYWMLELTAAHIKALSRCFAGSGQPFGWRFAAREAGQRHCYGG